MLGFTPLASAPLADSGVKNYEVIASDITAGAQRLSLIVLLRQSLATLRLKK